MTNRDFNTIRGMLFAYSKCIPTMDPVDYCHTFNEALSEYFKAYPNSDENDSNFFIRRLSLLMLRAALKENFTEGSFFDLSEFF